MDIDDFLKELEEAEQQESAQLNQELFPFDVIATGSTNQTVLLDEFNPKSSRLPLSLGPFGGIDISKELTQKFLVPNPGSLFKKSVRLLKRDLNLQEFVLLPELAPSSVHCQLNRNLLDGEVDISSFTKEYVEVSLETALNSTSFTRDPSTKADFVRGRSTNLPFIPGGMEAAAKDTDRFDNLDLLNEELLVVPPGLERGIDFGSTQSNRLDLSGLTFDDDELLQSLMEPEEAIDNTKTVDDTQEENKEIDEFLPETDALLAVAPVQTKSSKKKEWAIMVDVNQDFPSFHDLVPDMARKFPFELDVFQKRAVYHLEKSESVFVAAHTSAGKTVVAEYAIALAQQHMTRAIYTSPIKALSNQKFRDFKNTFEDVGILTGDIQIRPEAACLVMTTEILRSMLYRGADLIRDVEFVIFDEVHYVNDADRGVVWEEVIIMLPAHITLILLSATVPNTREFADWVGRTKQKNIYVISTLKRPVPLEHNVFVDKKLFKIVDANKTFLSNNYKSAYETLNPPKQAAGTGSNNARGKTTGHLARGGARNINVPKTQSGPKYNSGSAVNKNFYVNLIGFMKKEKLLPVIVFSFSKKKCEEYAQALSNLDLTSAASEKAQIHLFIENSLTCLVGEDRNLPQILRMKEMLSRGIAVHHSGLLPILKEIVEILFTRGLVKVLFSTETFAMGVNAPARAVVFAMTRKHDGQSFRNLLPGEYTQMSGRAGRRGLDSTGVVIIAAEDKIPDELELRTMILGRPTKLESQFRVTYNMILNLLRVEAIKVEDMIKRSFSENATQKNLPEQEALRKKGSEMLSRLEKIDCPFCNKDLNQFYESSSRILTLTYQMNEKIIKSAIGTKALNTGRVVVINNTMYRNCIGVILKSTGSAGISQKAETATRDILPNTLGSHSISSKDEKLFLVFIVTDLDSTSNSDIPALPVTSLNIPDLMKASYSIETLSYTTFAIITSLQLKVDADVISRKSELDILKSSVIEAAQTLVGNGPLIEYDWSKLRDLDFQQAYREKIGLLNNLTQYQSYRCTDLITHYAAIHREKILHAQIAELEHNLSDMNLDLLPDYHQRVDVLKELGFVDADDIVQVKGRVACEINTANELILTELIFDNFLNDFDAAEIVALLSCFVFQEKSDSEPILTPNLQKGVDRIVAATIEIANVQKSCGVDIDPDEFLRELNFGLVEVVYEWARGLPFNRITELTDVLEGSIVRCIVRLSETCREVSSAARVIGNASLYRKMEEATELIKRDIVFAASLYF